VWCEFGFFFPICTWSQFSHFSDILFSLIFHNYIIHLENSQFYYSSRNFTIIKNYSSRKFTILFFI
jgi:hypothetical protein